MSKDALYSLRDYIQLTLSPTDMRWLVEQLTPYSSEQENVKPYTKEEIDAMMDEAERDIAAGRVYTSEEVFAMLEEELGLKETPELHVAV